MFVEQYANYGLEELGTIAAAFLKEAGEQAVELPVDVSRFAGQTVPDATSARSAVAKRASLLRDKDERQKVASIIDELDGSTLDTDEAHKLAAWINDFDVAYGINFRWGREYTDPLRSVFGTASNVKTAGNDETVRVGSHLVKVAEFDEELGKLALGEDFTRDRLASLTPTELNRLAQYL